MRDRMPSTAGAHDAGCRAVAEQSGRHHVGGRELVHADGRSADLDGDHQHGRAWPRRCQTARNRQARDTARATETEHRHAFDIGAKAYTPGNACLEARRRNAGRGDGDNRVDLGGWDPRGRERPRRGLDEQFLRAFEIGRVALGPAQRGQVPVQGHHRVARFDSGGREDRHHSLEGGIAMGEDSPRRFGRFSLQEPMRRQGAGDGQQGTLMRHGVFLPPT